MRALVLSLGALLLAAPGAQGQTLVDPNHTLTTWATGLTRPTQLAFLGSEDVLVVEYPVGRVRRIIAGLVQPTVAFTLDPADGSGLLGIAIHPGDPIEVFLYVEDKSEVVGNRVNRYTWNPTAGVLENETLVHQFPPGVLGSIHDGGVLVLGPDDEPGGGAPYLYVAAGDREGSGQLQNQPAGVAPDDSGVVMRLRRDGSAAPGNPFAPYCSATTTQTCADDGDCPGAETCTTRVAKYFAYGIRNGFGLAFDPVTDRLWDTENGDADWDEVNRVDAGFNSGWLPLQGPGDPGSVTLFEMPGGASFYRDPDFAWLVPTGPTGIAFPHGSTLGAAWDRHVLFGDFNSPGRIYALPLDGARTGLDFSAFPALADGTADSAAELDLLEFGTGFGGSVLDLKFGPDGALYVVTYFDGTIHRVLGPRPFPLQIPAIPVLGLSLLCLALSAIGWRFAGRARWRS